jgi:hypothetical protein
MKVAISTTKKMMLGTTVGLVAVMTMLAPASARGRGHHHGHHHHHFRGWYGPAIVTYGYGSCDFYLRKWKYTGSGYWKAKYYACAY